MHTKLVVVRVVVYNDSSIFWDHGNLFGIRIVQDTESRKSWRQARKQMAVIKGHVLDLLHNNGMLRVLIRTTSMRRFY